MYLFIDTLSDPSFLAIFTKERTIQDRHTWIGKRQEFDSLIETIDSFLEENHYQYRDLSGIVVTIGPGSFTGTRVTTLIANTIGYSFGIPIYSITAGDMLSLQHAPLPWIMPVTKKEVLLWTKNIPEKYSLINKEDLPEEHYHGLAEIDFTGTKNTIKLVHDYNTIIHRLSLDKKISLVKPLYAKDPNITLKNTHAH